MMVVRAVLGAYRLGDQLNEVVRDDCRDVWSQVADSLDKQTLSSEADEQCLMFSSFKF